MLTQEEIAKLPQNPIMALHSVASTVAAEIMTYRDSTSKGLGTKEKFNKLLSGWALLLAITEKFACDNEARYARFLNLIPKQCIKNDESNIVSFYNSCRAIINSAEQILDSEESMHHATKSLEQYRQMVSGFNGYEFSDQDFENIQSHINELRTIISTSEEISDNHKSRLLKKLELFQSELHKKMDSLTMALGIIVDIGTTIGTFGDKVKPATDRVCEILKALHGAKVEAEQLPPGMTPTLALPAPQSIYSKLGN